MFKFNECSNSKYVQIEKMFKFNKWSKIKKCLDFKTIQIIKC
jgi:hypothetical protein